MGAGRAGWLFGIGLVALATAVAAADEPGAPGFATIEAPATTAQADFDAAFARVTLRGRPDGEPSRLVDASRPLVPLRALGAIDVASTGSTNPGVLPVPVVPPAQTAEAVPVPPAAVAAPSATGEAPLPAPPAAPVTLTLAERVAGAVEIRLRDAGSLWPARLPKRDRDAVTAFYAARAGRPLWIGEAGWSPKGLAVSARLGSAGEDGLDPAEYPVPRLGPDGRSDVPADLAEAELKLSAMTALYARDARGGRIDPTRLSSNITPKLDLPAADGVLAALDAAADPGAALAAYQPVYPGYRALRAKLAELRLNRPEAPSVRAPGRSVSGVQRIAALDDAPAPAALPSPRLEADILANMERWRWLPAELASRYLFVNVPEFRLRLFENGRVSHETRVITGKPESPTPIFSGTMDHAVVNPSWYIPPSIMKKEILTGLAADPDYAAKRGYEVIRRGSQISVRQPPGERNALGFIKFMFPNGHAVYLHDTPNRSLFGAARRAFSHGCVRVENPFLLADFVLGSEWTEQRLKALIGRGERTIRMKETVPVHLAYFTVAVDEFGDVRTFDDLYGYNRRVKAALGLGG